LGLADHKSTGAGDKGGAPQVVAKHEVQRVVLAHTCTCVRCKPPRSRIPSQAILYWCLSYGALNELRNDKKETHSVEGVSAELRHYLKRLARRSRCFSRCPYALKCAVRLLVFCYNLRQLWKRLYPAYPANIIDFLHLQV